MRFKRTSGSTILSSILGISLFFCFEGVNAQKKPSENFAFEQNERMGRGVNIIGYDPIWDNMSDARMKAKHFQIIKEAGFDNVRVKISPFRFSTDEQFTIDPKFFNTLDWILEQALSNDLMTIVDFHEHETMEKDPIGTQPMFLAMWKQIAEHYKAYPNEVLFEIANEPNMDPEVWNDLHAKAYKIIRNTNPERTLLIGTIYGNQIKHLKDLKLPEKDRNIIVAIHYYSPIQFTHQGAPWSKNNKNLSGITWYGTEEEKNAVKENFDIATQWAKAHNRPLTLGEFGAYEKADIKSRVLWTDYIARQAEARSWSWSYWQFDSDFIVYDIDKAAWFQPIKEALIPLEKVSIQTVTGQISGDEMGVTLPHEHVMSNFGLEPGQASTYNEKALLAQVVPYLQKLKVAGVQTIFDCTAAYFGRRVDLLKEISEKSGIHIVTNTGYYGAANDAYVPYFALKATKEAIAQVWIDEFRNGIEGTGIKPGFIKLAFDSGEPSAVDEKLFEAGILTHLETGLTLAVHTGDNPEAIDFQTNMLAKYDVPLSAWIWVHADKSDDIAAMLDLASKGAWISLDGFKLGDTTDYLEKIKRFKSAGLLNQLLLSHDGNSFPKGGEIRPYDALLSDLRPSLVANGFSPQDIEILMVKNSASAFGIKTDRSK